jgi:hypothetical protein
VSESVVDRDAIASTIPSGSISWIDRDAPAAQSVPDRWTTILAEDPGRDRARRTMSAWDSGLLRRLPRFATLMEERLVDVQAAVIDGEPMLVHVTLDGDDPAPWTGTAPADGSVASRVAPLLPPELQAFQRELHAGFGLTWPGLYGFRPPSQQVSRYDRLGLADLGVDPDEAVVEAADGTLLREDELFVVSSDGNQSYRCVSPRLEAGAMALVDHDELEVGELWPSLDAFMVVHYRNVVY